MRETVPEVFLISRPIVDLSELKRYVDSVGGAKWYERIHSALFAPAGDRDGEVLIEAAGRLCYKSWDVGLNPNVTKIREDSQEYLLNILQQKHGSVLEHANYSFIFKDVSRVFTHELVRHRSGVAISQESMRYVRLTDIGFRTPEILKEAGLEESVTLLVETVEEFQNKVNAGIKWDKMPFDKKKQLTSALRRVMPDGVSTTLMWTANVRALRHVISMRTDPGAEEEIRFVFRKVAEIMLKECPSLFGDFVENEKGAYVTPYWKV